MCSGKEEVSKMSNRGPKGFTLIELLVVIAIIGMLAALLLPAILRSTESARQAKCANYQKELGVAVTSYTVRKGHYPGYREPGGYSWVVAIFQDLDRMSLWKDWRDGSGAAVRLDQLVCPADEEASGDAPLSYVVNTTIFVDRSTDASEFTIPGDTTRIPSSTTTVMLGENYEEAGGREWTDTLESEVGFVPAATTVGELFPSNHPAGSVVTFCDGHTQFLRDTTIVNADGTITPVDE